MARYLLNVTFEPGVEDSPLEEWQPEEITPGGGPLRDARAAGAQPVGTFAHAVALAEAEGPDAATPLLANLEPTLGDTQRWHAVSGHVAELAGDHATARHDYLAAARKATNLAEQRHLVRRAAASPGV